MAPLFSKVDSNKLFHGIQHEEDVIYAQFGKDLFNISKVIGRKIVAQFFWLTVYRHINMAKTVVDLCVKTGPTNFLMYRKYYNAKF